MSPPTQGINVRLKNRYSNHRTIIPITIPLKISQRLQLSENRKSLKVSFQWLRGMILLNLNYASIGESGFCCSHLIFQGKLLKLPTSFSVDIYKCTDSFQLQGLQ